MLVALRNAVASPNSDATLKGRKIKFFLEEKEKKKEKIANNKYLTVMNHV